MPSATIELLKNGTDANNTDPYRHGNVIVLPNTGDIVVSGDLHGHIRNFQRIVKFAALADNPARHLVLQEIIHGGPEDNYGGCLSFGLLYEAVKLKVAFPHRVHFMLANHDTSFISDSEVMKNGKEMNAAMKSAMIRKYSHDFDGVEIAFKQFLFSQPLGMRCANRIWISHSLPGNREVDSFDPEVLHRPLQIADLNRPNSVYNFTWGRRHNRQTLDKMAKILDVDIFVLGHQAQLTGFMVQDNDLLILASDHNHGMILKFDLDRNYDMPQLVDNIVPLASIA